MRGKVADEEAVGFLRSIADTTAKYKQENRRISVGN
jgi:hypothetical protein